MLITLPSKPYETFKGSQDPRKTQNDKIRIFDTEAEGQKSLTSLVFPFDIFEETTSRSAVAGRSGQF